MLHLFFCIKNLKSVFFAYVFLLKDVTSANNRSKNMPIGANKYLVKYWLYLQNTF